MGNMCKLKYNIDYTCFGQPANFFNQSNFGKKQVPGAQSCPNTFFPNNLTRNGNCGVVPITQHENMQKMPNIQPSMNLKQEQPLNLQQAMSLQQMNMQAMANLEQQSLNLQQRLPVAAPLNGPASLSFNPHQSPLEPTRNGNVPVPTSVTDGPLPYQLPMQSTIPVQYSIQNIPQSFSVPVSTISPYSVSQNYGFPVSSGLIGSNNIPVAIVENSRPSFNPFTNSHPSIISYFPRLDSNPGIMLGQNDVMFKTQNLPAPAYISIIQSSPAPPQYRVAPSYPINTVVTPDENQNSKSSSVKALLPILINMLKEKNTQCPCHTECNCDGKKKRTRKPQITSGYSKQKKYPLSEDGPAIEQSQEIETTRNVREPKKAGKLKNFIPDESTEVHHDDSLEYSEEEDNEEK